VGAKSLTRVSATQFTILACDATAYFTTDRRIRVVGATTDQGFVTSSSYGAPDTTVNVVMDSADVPTAPTQALVLVDAKIRGSAYKKPGTGNGLDADLLDGLHATSLYPRGLLHARISYTSASTITVGRGFTQKILADIDGVLLEGSSDLVIDLASADREDTSGSGGSAAETVSTWYYLYLYSNAGVLAKKISFTAPVMDPASGKVGYHPGTGAGSVTWRCIGAVFNNSASDIQPFDYNPKSGLWQFRKIVAAFTKSPGFVNQSSYTTVALTATVPATARQVRLSARVQDAEDVVWYYGHETVTGVVSSNTTGNIINTTITGGSSNPGGTIQFEIAVDSTPAFAWGNVVSNLGGGTIPIHTVDPIGWTDDFGLIG
jgi:hypothetical protein